MIILKTIEEVRNHIRSARDRGEKIGFVPTMGFLHEGHLSLVRAAVEETDCSVVSIFVNPAQFGPSEDFAQYPRDDQRDLGLLKAENVDVVFMPDEKEIYPSGHKTYVEVKELEHKLCGISRPTFFRGVCTVVNKLFNIVLPDILYFGQKDFQQALIIKKMVHDLNMKVTVKVLPIIRDQDGLALSSRNMYLSSEERRSALSLSRSLDSARKWILEGERDAKKIIARIREILQNESLLKIDYVEIVDLHNIDPVSTIKESILIALAAVVGKARLIDNTIVHIEESE